MSFSSKIRSLVTGGVVGAFLAVAFTVTTAALLLAGREVPAALWVLTSLSIYSDLFSRHTAPAGRHGHEEPLPAPYMVPHDG